MQRKEDKEKQVKTKKEVKEKINEIIQTTKKEKGGKMVVMNGSNDGTGGGGDGK